MLCLWDISIHHWHEGDCSAHPARQPAFPFSITAHFNGKSFLRPYQQTATNSSSKMPSSLLLLFPCRLLCGMLKKQLLPWFVLQTHLICFKHESHFLLPTLAPVCLSRFSPTLRARLSHLHLQEPSWKMQCPLALPLPFQSCHHSMCCSFSD